MASVVHPKLPQILESNWSPPKDPLYKINVDGTVFPSQKEAGVRVIIRDQRGLFIAGLSKKIPTPLDAIEVEAKAFEASFTFATAVGIYDFVIEGDSLNIVQALRGESPPPSSLAPLIYGMFPVVNDFWSIHFSHVRRTSNWLAHLLAMHVLGICDFSA